MNNLNIQELVCEQDDIRLDKYLVSKIDHTRNYIEQLIKTGCININNHLVNKTGLKLKRNDLIAINWIKLNSLQKEKFTLNNHVQIKFKVIYEDDYLMVIYKPKDVLCHKTSFNEDNTLIEQLIQYFNDKNLHIDDLKELRNGLIHRIDKDTSGLLLVAKTRVLFNQLKLMLEQKNIKRYYYAIVLNPFVNTNELMINLPLNHDQKSTRMIVDKNGKEALTKVKVIQNFKHYAFVECELFTGRTHQIRAHLKAINHPIFNDPLYGVSYNNLNQYLSAHKMTFIHPVTNKYLEFEIGIEPYIQAKIEELKNEK